MNNKKTDTKTKTTTTTIVDPKRNVQVIELDHLENVVGGVGSEDGEWSEGLEDSAWPGENRRMSTEA